MSRPSLGAGVGLALMLSFATAHGAADVPDDFVDELVVGGLDEPLSMAFLPDGRLLVVEQRTGRVRLVVGGHVAATDPVYTVPSLNADAGERGLQGVAVDPGWPARPYVYLVYTRTGDRLRLARYTASGDLTQPAGENLTLGSPLLLLDDLPDLAGNHNGGTLRIGPDDHLYLSLGEDAVPCAAQDSTGLRGVLLRLDLSRLPAGGGGPVPRALLIPSDPALASPDSNARLVHAYGLRNPWRFHIDPATGLTYLGDVGDATYEELNEVAAGDNLGWPFREGTMVRSGSGCSEPGGSGAYRAPIRTVNHSTGARAILSAGVYHPTGAASWPTAYAGDLFHSDYFLGHVRRMERSGGTWSGAPAVPGQPSATEWATGLTWPVDFAVGPDGSLWWLSQYDAGRSARSGSVRRIRYTGTPVAVEPGVGARVALRAAPNPFGASIEFAFAMASAGPARVQVFDTRGRRVRSLFDAEAPAGETRLRWDGTTESGRAAPPGIYFVRVEHPRGAETVRVLRLR